MRADFNVPMENGKIKDDYKMAATLPTIRFLLRYKCKVIIATHLKINQKLSRRRRDKNQKYNSIKPIALYLGGLLDKKIKFVNDCVGAKVEKSVNKMKEGDILMLENLRFYDGEKNNDKKFARDLAALADICVNDAFAASHRAHASVSAIKKYLPVFAGLLLEKEILNLNKILKPKKPLVTIIGGAKISTKLPLLKNLLKKTEHILVGGALANNFLAAKGYKTGRSLVSDENAGEAKKISLRAGEKIVLPIDVIVGGKKNGGGKVKHRKIKKIDKNDIILDIGPETIRYYANFIRRAKTIIWNGPMGMFETEHFRHGTLAVARIVAARSQGAAFGAVGGGETIEALKMTKMSDYVDWISTGGGAMLAYLGGERMPGLEGIVKYK